MRKSTVHFFIDGSYKEISNLNRVTKSTGFGIVVVEKGEVLFKHCGKVPLSERAFGSRNVAGEIYASMEALKIAIANSYTNIAIHHKFEGLEKLLTGELPARTSLTKTYVDFFKKNDNIKYKFMQISPDKKDTFSKKADELAKLGTTLV